MNEQIREAGRRIREAFASVEQPRNRNITSHRCEECDELRDTFSGLKWDAIDPVIIDSNFGQLSLFSPQAYQYFLPAYLLRCLDNFDPSNMVCEFTIYSLSPTRGRDADSRRHSERLKEFTETQKDAIMSFLNLLKASEVFSEFHDDVDIGLVHWKSS
jgi:hypothetical protein